jgi:hypothetical protein
VPKGKRVGCVAISSLVEVQLNYTKQNSIILVRKDKVRPGSSWVYTVFIPYCICVWVIVRKYSSSRTHRHPLPAPLLPGPEAPDGEGRPGSRQLGRCHQVRPDRCA